MIKNLPFPQIWGISPVLKFVISPDLGKWPRSGWLLTVDVMGMDTEFPIVLTTTKTNHCCYLEMRGKRYTISTEAGLLTQITQPDARSSQRSLFLASTPLSWEGPTSPRSASIHPVRPGEPFRSVLQTWLNLCGVVLWISWHFTTGMKYDRLVSTKRES